MKRIVAIGGGEIGRQGYQIETQKIDEEIIRLSGKKSPLVLFIPTASGDSEGYISVFQNYFGKKLSCKTDVLLLNKNVSRDEIRNKILSSDIVYVGGGNTLKMIAIWKRFGVDKVLEEAWKKGIIMSGLSAGAICWFKFGHSDSQRFDAHPEWNFIKVKALGWFNFIFCPHYHFEKREKGFATMIRKNGGIGLAFDNKTAIEIINDKFRILKSDDNAKAYRILKKNGKVVTEELIAENLKPLTQLSQR